MAVSQSQINQRTPVWIIGEEAVDVDPNQILVFKNVKANYKGFIQGVWLSTDDPAGNTFKIKWFYEGVAKTQSIVFGGLGTVKDTEQGASLNEQYPADPNTPIALVVAKASSVGKMCQASILIAEVPI